MHRHLHSSIIVILTVTLFSACSHVPDHIRYIPKDAVVVAGINLKTLSKKIMWNVITDSKLFKEMQSHVPEKNAKDAMSGIQNAGLDISNTFYVYVKSDNRFKGGSRVTALVPLSDAGQWENYIKTVFTKVEIKEHDNRKEASLSRDMYVGWNKNLLIIINMMPTIPDYADMPFGGKVNIDQEEKPAIDLAAISAEMDNAFKVSPENSISGNVHFTMLEKEGHDITLWLNYEQLMTQMSGNMAEKIGMSLSADLWKDVALAAGFDFKKGKISSDMHYYLSTDLKEVGTELGAANADKDMIARLPNKNLDMLAAMHIAPKAVKGILEKMNLLGLANLGLSAQKMDADFVLDAFTGDMAFVMNDFSLRNESLTDMYMGHPVAHNEQNLNLTFSYVVKIGKKENFDRLLKIAKDMGLQSSGSGYVIPINDKNSVYILLNNDYLAASNRYGYADSFLKGVFKSQKLPDAAASSVPGHPVAFYFDVQEFCKHIDAGITHSTRDSFMINESKKLLNNITFAGGAFKDNAFEYHLDVNFMNTEENSIIQLMDYSMKMNDANKINPE